MADATENGHGHVNARRTWIIVIGLILAVVVLAAFVSLHRSQVAIRIGRADRQTITESIATNGKIEALNNFEAYAPMATTVKKINVQQGSWVKPGQLLLQLEDANARLQAARAEAQLKGAEADINAVENGGTKEELLTTRNALVKAQAERDVAQRNLQAMQHLLQSGAASQAEVDAAHNQFRIAEANVQLLQQKLGGRYSKQEIGHVEAQQTEGRASLAAAQQLLKNSNIVAPRAGMVYSLPVRQGAFVNAGDLLVQVADLHKVRVRAFVDEPEIGKLQKGQLVEVTWDAVPGRVWQGTVDALPTTVVQHGTRMVGEVTCVVENGDLTLLPNTNISVAVVIARQQDALTVPREAVHQDASGQFVFQVINGELQRRDVKTSVANLTRIQVTSGLTDNAVLALGAINMQSLRAGMPVKIANP
ncbi:MAG TPA: efflux RND transporter periplasmic adaptor subunit [Candidatus Limnocylindrales bacterium]|nr:efflux RND transporter periplasmic adaptor subunit [Candidatus Limnocylindrales bacterium]